MTCQAMNNVCLALRNHEILKLLDDSVRSVQSVCGCFAMSNILSPLKPLRRNGQHALL